MKTQLITNLLLFSITGLLVTIIIMNPPAFQGQRSGEEIPIGSTFGLNSNDQAKFVNVFDQQVIPVGAKQYTIWYWRKNIDIYKDNNYHIAKEYVMSEAIPQLGTVVIGNNKEVIGRVTEIRMKIDGSVVAVFLDSGQ